MWCLFNDWHFGNVLSVTGKIGIYFERLAFSMSPTYNLVWRKLTNHSVHHVVIQTVQLSFSLLNVYTTKRLKARIPTSDVERVPNCWVIILVSLIARFAVESFQTTEHKFGVVLPQMLQPLVFSALLAQADRAHHVGRDQDSYFGSGASAEARDWKREYD